MPGKILVTCASGRIGTDLVNKLAGAGEKVRAAVRNPSTAASKFNSAVESVLFDYEKPKTFAAAVKGIDKIFLMVRPGDNHSDTAAAPLIDEARVNNVQHIVDLTAMGVEDDEDFMLRKLEKYIEDSGIPFTHLRPNWFMQNFNSGPMYADIKSTGSLHLPASDAKLSFIDVRDIADAGLEVLKDDSHTGKSYTLTGGEALDHFEAVGIISEAAKKKISYVPLSDQTARSALAKAGVADELIERWSNFYKRVREGYCGRISEDILTLIKRTPITFRQFAGDNASAWS